MASIIDEIYDHMLNGDLTLTNREILKRFFKIESADTSVSERIVKPLFHGDARFQLQGEKWRALPITTIEETPISQAPFILFSIAEIDRVAVGGKDVFSAIDHSSSFILYRGGIAVELHDIKRMLDQVHEYIFLPYDVKSLSRLRRIYRMISPLTLEIKTLSIKSLVSHLYPEKKYNRWEDIIQDLSIINFESGSPLSRVKTLRQVFEWILSEMKERGIRSTGELIEISNRVDVRIKFSKYGFDRGFLRNIPEQPGVYLFYNREDRVIYVGKTKNLKTRINSYFRYTGESIEKRELILQHLYEIKYEKLGSDLEALIEEYRLIDRYRPLFNKKTSIPERIIEISDRILVLPSSRDGSLKLYFLSNKVPLVEYVFGPEDDGTAITRILKRIETSDGYVFDPLKILALSYMKRYEEYINIIEIERYGSPGDVLNAIVYHRKHLKELAQEKITLI